MEEEGRESGYQPELRYKCVYHMKTLQNGIGCLIQNSRLWTVDWVFCVS